MTEPRDITTLPLTDPGASAANHSRSVLPKRRDLVVEYPGQINYLSKHGQVAGCRIASFGYNGWSTGLQPADARALEAQVKEEFPGTEDAPVPAGECSPTDTINTYFRHRANLYIVDTLTAHDDGGAIRVVFSTAMDKEDLEQFHEAGAYTAVVMQGIRGELGVDIDENLAEFRKSCAEIENRMRACDAERAKELDRQAATEQAEKEKERLAELGRIAELQGWKGRIASLEETNRKLGGND